MTKENTAIEKRHFERIPSKIHLTLTQLKVSAEKSAGKNAISKDITVNGVSLISPERYSVGALLNVEICLEGWQLFLQTVLKRNDGNEIKPLVAIGKVVWSQKLPGSSDYQTGVQFLEIEENDFAAFKKYLHIIRESVREKI